MAVKEKWINLATVCLSLVLIAAILWMAASFLGKAPGQLIAVTGQGAADRWMCSSRAHGKVAPAQVAHPTTPQTP